MAFKHANKFSASSESASDAATDAGVVGATDAGVAGDDVEGRPDLGVGAATL